MNIHALKNQCPQPNKKCLMCACTISIYVFWAWRKVCRITLYCLPWRKTGGTGGNFNWRLTFFIYVIVVSHKNEFKIFKNSDWLTLIFEQLVFAQAHLFCSLIVWNRDDRLAHVEICYIDKWAYNDCLGPWDRSENTAWLPRNLTQKVNSDSKRLSELQENCMRLSHAHC